MAHHGCCRSSWTAFHLEWHQLPQKSVIVVVFNFENGWYIIHLIATKEVNSDYETNIRYYCVFLAIGYWNDC